MRVVQLLPTLVTGDAVGNDARALRRCLARWDRKTEIFAENIGPGLAGEARPAALLPPLGEDDVLIYHLSTGSALSRQLDDLSCRKVMIYHNVTPPEYFAPYSAAAAALCREGLDDMRRLRDSFDWCAAVSEFNRQGLLDAGYSCPVDVCPVLIPFADYDAAPDPRTLERWGDGRTNFLFVGRVAPNKKQEDVIAAFACYQRQYDPDARLILAGGDGGLSVYRRRLWAYTRALGARNVVFTGSIRFSELLALYRTAAVFVCMSEHEGFCVPLLEAMHFRVPIAAYAAAAVPETLGGSGLLLREKTPELWAAALRRLVSDAALRESVTAAQDRRLENFAAPAAERRFADLFEAFLARPRREQPPRVVQMVPVLSRGDAVSNDVLALRGVLRGLPCRESVWTLDCPDDMAGGGVRRAPDPPALTARDTAVFHMGMGAEMADRFAAMNCRKILIYHNITPPEFFEPYSRPIADGCRWGLRQTALLARRAELCLADSGFNRDALRDMGARDAEVLPVLVPFADYAAGPDGADRDGRTHLLFVGRVVPNKKLENVVRAFACYQTRYDPDARLTLAGGADTVPAYTARLRAYIAELGVRGVTLTGKIPFGALLALYRSADVFLCLSEHEGFCVPLLEAMLFDVPVAALAAAAVPETLGGSGVLLPDADPAAAAAAVHALVTDGAHRAAVLAGQRRRLADFAPETTGARARELFADFLGGCDGG